MSLLPYTDGWEARSSSCRRAPFPSLDYEWEDEVKEEEVEQRMLAPEDFVAADEAERRAFELAKRLSEEEAEAEQKTRGVLGTPRHRYRP
jgi:hypothetical protein